MLNSDRSFFDHNFFLLFFNLQCYCISYLCAHITLNKIHIHNFIKIQTVHLLCSYSTELLCHETSMFIHRNIFITLFTIYYVFFSSFLSQTSNNTKVFHAAVNLVHIPMMVFCILHFSLLHRYVVYRYCIVWCVRW